MKVILVVLTTFISTSLFSQVSPRELLLGGKAISKEITLHIAKEFIIKEVLGVSKNAIKVKIDPLEGSYSGELTTLVYDCQELNKQGLVFSFYNYGIDETGFSGKAYSFKNFPKKEALELLDKLEVVIDNNEKYLKDDKENANVYFEFDNIVILISANYNKNIKMRFFYEGFDAEWDMTAFNKTKTKLQAKLE